MTPRPLPIPPWAPIVAAAAFVVWAVSIWWMVATLPAADTSPIEDAVDVLAAQIESTDGAMAELSEQVAALEAERDTLVQRIAELESHPRVPVTGSTSTDEDAAALTDEADDTAEVVVEGDTPISGTAGASRFFTDGADRYNCRDFTSHEEAQEALAVNGPEDSNRIDMNRNGIACEDFVYPAATAGAATVSAPHVDSP